MRALHIDRRFCGPPGIVNGGYLSGRVASVLGGAVEVTLRAPTPPETELTLERQGDRATLRSLDGALLAEAIAVERVELTHPELVSFEAATEASTRYVGFREHPYPSCFVCGPQRPAELGPGLRLFAGAVDRSAPIVAAPFVPTDEHCDAHGLLRAELVWAALDCPSWFGHAAFLQDVPPILLGRLAVQVLRRPATGERCIVHGFSLVQEGRRIHCGSALASADGEWLAHARATWVELKRP